jgi:two-component system CheB/CheR fusion protein
LDQENTRRAEELERELRSTKEYLQTTIEELETSNEELKSTNEELQSSNEELQSTNEELETSKEELQSVNEELVTVNSEHEVKLEELAKSNNDLANLLASTDVGILFLDLDLRIRRFTPTVTEVINLIPTDLGRPLGHIVSNLGEDLVHHARKVLDTLVLTTKEVRGKDGRWYLMGVKLYRTVENAVDGIVMTFVDLTEQKRMQFLERLATVVRDSNDAITLQDSEGRILAWNRGAERMYGWSETEALAMNIEEIVPKDKRQETLSYVKALAAGEVVESFETQRITKDGRRLDVWLTVTNLAEEEGKPAMIATTERDITRR